ncbi:MAG: hypothetical protein QGG64_27400, partial [Candidatus Latescibacteria bacterium]|nr:hypothetical protein [Candidatus Latescibacterota bacterium]
MEQEYPTLARLSFCIAPDRQQAFQEAYAQQLCPILARYGLVADNAKPQDSGEGVLSYFFTVPSPGAVIEYEERLNQDSQWIQAIRQMGIAFVEDRGSYLKIFHHFGAYSGSLGQPTVRSVDVDAR